MNLNISEWKPFIIEKLFTVKYGVNLAERIQIMEFQLL